MGVSFLQRVYFLSKIRVQLQPWHRHLRNPFNVLNSSNEVHTRKDSKANEGKVRKLKYASNVEGCEKWIFFYHFSTLKVDLLSSFNDSF